MVKSYPVLNTRGAQPLALRFIGPFALALGLASCAGEPEPVAVPPQAKPAKPSAPGSPTLGDVVDEIEQRRRVIEKLEEIEKDEP